MNNNDPNRSGALNRDEKFGKIFHPKIIEGLVSPKMDDGTEMCRKWHGKRFCVGDNQCKFARSHKLLNNEERKRWCEFVKQCKNKEAESSRNIEGEN